MGGAPAPGFRPPQAASVRSLSAHPLLTERDVSTVRPRTCIGIARGLPSTPNEDFLHWPFLSVRTAYFRDVSVGIIVISRDLQAVAEAAHQNGWGTSTGSIEDVRSAALRLGWREVPNRASGPAVSTLRPMTQSEAAPRSLSAIHGLDIQPLHTDGAHIRIPPDIVVLVSSEPTPVPTLVRRAFQSTGRIRASPPHLDHGVFLIRSGRESFYATARTSKGVRFDPGCMTPCDQRARELTDYFARLSDEAEEHHWTDLNQVLVIDNHRTVHARAAVSSPSDRKSRILSRISFLTESRQ